MQDDKPQDEHDDFENDLDIDDLEEDDDFDAPWNDLDEQDDIPELEEVSPAASKAPSLKRKTFLQKNFPFVVGGIVVLGGAMLLLPALTKPKSTSQTEAGFPKDAASIEGLDSGVPPMPVPMDGQAPDETGVPLGDAEAQQPLTPMPELEEQNDFAEQPALPAETAEAENDLEANTVPPLEERADAGAETNAEPASLEASPVSDFLQGLPEETPSLPIEETPHTPKASLAESPPTAATAQSGAPQVLEAVPSVDTQALRAEADQATLKAQEADQARKSAEKKASELEKTISSNEETIADLKKTVEALKKEVTALKENSAEILKPVAKAPVKDIKKTPAPSPKTASSPPETKAPAPLVIAPVVKPQARASAAPAVMPPAAQPSLSPSKQSWVLRSAQPGRAVLARENNNDLQTIVVGDTLAELGRIVSIQQEGGRWVVRGTQGEVSR
ncbi:MAG: hypothetical protein IT559_00180 [Alphaproteobacteria bacterium]|nr:hypothetical protein [Alphaproteobacteria bacterium]